jgi:uncharacterized damage-inducible protein DinB
LGPGFLCDNRAMSELARIADQLERAFRGEAWHGPAVMELLAGVTADQAAAHPINHAHSIWEIVLHITAWKQVVARRVRGEAVELQHHEDWPKVARFSEETWAAAVRNLTDAHQAVQAALSSINDARLHQRVPGKDYDLYFMLHGLPQHDLYHAGQIALLKRA